MGLQGYRLVFLFHHSSDKRGIGGQRRPKWVRQGMSVGDVGELESIGTRIEAAGLEIAKGNICLRWGRQKVRK